MTTTLHRFAKRIKEVMNIKYTLTYDGYEFGLGSKKWIQDPVLQVFLCIVLVNY